MISKKSRIKNSLQKLSL